MLQRISGFVAALRTAGVPVSMTEHTDAARALCVMPLDDRAGLRAALAATMVKRAEHAAVFAVLFDVWFPLAPGAAAADRSEEGGLDGDADLDALAALLAAGDLDADALRRFVAAAVNAHAGMEPGRPVGGTYYLYRTLRALDLDGLRERLLEAAGAGRLGAGLPADAWARRLAADEVDGRIERLRREIEAEIRRRLVADRGPEAVAAALRLRAPEDVEIMNASREELAVLERAVGPLARALAARLAQRRRRSRRGQLDFRATVRRSLAYGGVPVEPRLRQRHPGRPEIMVIADVSGSVASFARFTLQLVHALASRFSRVRSFAFIDGIDEVTRFFGAGADPAVAARRVATEADVIWVDGHSDYGHAFSTFVERWGSEVTARTSVLVLGDARNNYHATGAASLAALAARARHVYWLDPEPAAYWNTGDSVIAEYARHCDGVFECRNLRQLQGFVTATVLGP